MKLQQRKPNMFHRLNRAIGSTRLGAWSYSYVLPPIDKSVLKLTGNRKTLTEILGALNIVTLTTVGAKTGKRRSKLLLATQDEKDLLLLASNWGGKRNPGWYWNLRANPEAVISIGREEGACIVREASDDERERYWNIAVKSYSGYEVYKGRTGGRKIPIMVLSPKDDTP